MNLFGADPQGSPSPREKCRLLQQRLVIDNSPAGQKINGMICYSVSMPDNLFCVRTYGMPDDESYSVNHFYTFMFIKKIIRYNVSPR